MTRRIKKQSTHREPTGNVKFGKMVADMREGKHMSQTLLAGKCGIGRSLMCLIENGSRRPTSDQLFALGLIFEKDMADLYKACSPLVAKETEERVQA